MTQEALKLAIQLRDTASGYWTEQEIPIIDKLIELLAQHDSVQAKPEPEQEPVVSKWVLREVYFDEDGEPIAHRSTPQRTWVGLTVEDVHDCLKGLPTQSIEVYARSVEAKLKQKNGFVEEKNT